MTLEATSKEPANADGRTEPLCRCEPGICLLHPSLTTCGMRERGQDHAVEWKAMVEQFCRDLNAAHDEILRAQGVTADQFMAYDWPVWSAPANSIQWAERTLGKPLSKTSLRAEAQSADSTPTEDRPGKP